MEELERLRTKCREEHYNFYNSLLGMTKAEIILNQSEKIWFLRNVHELIETNYFCPTEDVVKKILSCDNFLEKLWNTYVQSNFSDCSDWSKLMSFIYEAV